jgi:hypothetical protein
LHQVHEFHIFAGQGRDDVDLDPTEKGKDPTARWDWNGPFARITLGLNSRSFPLKQIYPRAFLSDRPEGAINAQIHV